MKKIIVAAALLSALVSANAQGVVALKNIGSGANGTVNAPVFTDATLTTRLAGAGFSAQLWAGADANSLAPVGAVVSFNTAALAGYFASTPNVAIPGIAAGGTATVQVRAWDNAGGTITSYDNALNRGFSNTLTVGLVDANNPAVNTLVGLQSFGLTVVPEPSVIGLAIAGAGILFLRRKR